nr:MAG TPA: hypothetical protein [Caudoviricetes sp.]
MAKDSKTKRVSVGRLSPFRPFPTMQSRQTRQTRQTRRPKETMTRNEKKRLFV